MSSLVRAMCAAMVAYCVFISSQAEAVGLTIMRVVVIPTKSTVAVTLDRRSQLAFSRFTSEHVGREAALCVDGKSIAEPIIRAPIRGRQIEISLMDGGDLTAAWLAKKLSRPGAKIDVSTSNQKLCTRVIH
jgi:preprotein translocase subunit SecD